MALKPSYVIEGEVWIPLARAAALLSTSVVAVKALMASGELAFTNVPRGRSVLVERAGVLRLREERKALAKQIAKRTRLATRTAQERGASQRAVPPRTGSGAAFVRTWDPSPYVLPISGRDAESSEE